jgi:hypothetical protein
MEKVEERIACIGDDGSSLTILLLRHSDAVETGRGVRFVLGARRFAMPDGGAVRYLDRLTFEVVATGELVRRRSSP